MDPAQLEERRSQVQVVDVRYPNEWEAGRIDGSVHIPEDELDDRLEDIDRQKPVVTVCRSGSRSAGAAASLRDEGFEAESLDGGLEAWAAAGLPLTAGDGGPGRVVEPEPPPDDRPPELRRLEATFMETLMAVHEHFGDREASDEEVRAFLRQRLIDQGRSPEDADRFMEEMDDR